MSSWLRESNPRKCPFLHLRKAAEAVSAFNSIFSREFKPTSRMGQAARMAAQQTYGLPRGGEVPNNHAALQPNRLRSGVSAHCGGRVEKGAYILGPRESRGTLRILFRCLTGPPANRNNAPSPYSNTRTLVSDRDSPTEDTRMARWSKTGHLFSHNPHPMHRAGSTTGL